MSGGRCRRGCKHEKEGPTAPGKWGRHGRSAGALPPRRGGGTPTVQLALRLLFKALVAPLHSTNRCPKRSICVCHSESRADYRAAGPSWPCWPCWCLHAARQKAWWPERWRSRRRHSRRRRRSRRRRPATLPSRRMTPPRQPLQVGTCPQPLLHTLVRGLYRPRAGGA